MPVEIIMFCLIAKEGDCCWCRPHLVIAMNFKCFIHKLIVILYYYEIHIIF